MAGPQEMMGQLVNSIKNLSSTQKIVFGVVVIGAIFAMGSLIFRAPGTDYKVLFSGLAQEDAAAVVARLQEQRIPYQLAQDGTAIMVPTTQVHEVRLSLAGEGLPRGGGIGFELFDKTSLGTTDFVQKLNYQRALQGELARTISGLDQIASARVHIATPKESVFIEDEKEPSASVIIALRGREKLSTTQIKSIVNLVASAVPGLTPDNITVVDTAGRLLFRQEGDQMSMQSSTQHEYQLRVEEALRRKVEGLLEEVVGAGRAQARVTAEINFSRVNVTQENFDPEGQVVRSEQVLDEQDQQGSEQPSGIPGVKGNLATFAESGESGAGGENYKRSNITRNYEISRVTRHVEEATGEIRRLSVAVMIDGSYERQTDDKGNTTLHYTARTPDELKSFEKIVRNAIGYSEERGDTVEVAGVPFAASSALEPEASGVDKWSAIIDKLVMPIVYLLMAVAFIMFVIRPFFRMLGEKQVEAEDVPVRAATTARRAASEGGGEEDEDLGFAPKKMTDKERIYKLAQSDPDRAADLVRRWLREEI